MARVKRGVTARRRHHKILKLARGYRGKHGTWFRIANQYVTRALAAAYRDRRKRRGDFRKLWIARINAATRRHGLPYSRFINALRRSGVEINRKVLADLAVRDEAAFSELVKRAQEHLKA